MVKKPSKEQRLITEDSHLIESYVTYTPTSLRDIAHNMEENNISSVEVSVEGYEGYFECSQTRMETTQEAYKRYEVELKTYNKQCELEKSKKEKEKENIIKRAKKLGLKITED